MQTRSEKEKMLSGELYNAMDAQLVRERERARELVHQFNNEQDKMVRDGLLKQLMGNHGEGSFIEPTFRCDYGYNIHYGKSFFANFGCVMLDVCKITIGNNVLFGPNVNVYTATHPVDPEERKSGLEYAKPIEIGDDVWIGGAAIILPGVKIGKGTTIGAGAVVTKDIPPYVVAAGNPCKVIKYLKEPQYQFD